MFSSMMNGFRKNEDCPSSHELLAFQKGDLGGPMNSDVRCHLGSCDFCEAEVEFYSHYPQEDAGIETVESGAIPAPLFELAEALLRGRHGDSGSLNSLLRERDELVLDKS
jgi:hypothetical protein